MHLDLQDRSSNRGFNRLRNRGLKQRNLLAWLKGQRPQTTPRGRRIDERLSTDADGHALAMKRMRNRIPHTNRTSVGIYLPNHNVGHGCVILLVKEEVHRGALDLGVVVAVVVTRLSFASSHDYLDVARLPGALAKSRLCFFQKRCVYNHGSDVMADTYRSGGGNHGAQCSDSQPASLA